MLSYFYFINKFLLCLSLLVPNIFLLNFITRGVLLQSPMPCVDLAAICFDARERLWQVGDCRDKDNGGKESPSVTLPLPPAVWPEHSWGQHMLSAALSVLTWSHE